MTVGMKIRVFEIVKDDYGLGIKGNWYGEAVDHYLGNEFGVNIHQELIKDRHTMHLPIDSERAEGRCVGCFTVKRLHNNIDPVTII